MLAPNPQQNKTYVLQPAEDFEEGRWQQVSLPKRYHEAMHLAFQWKESGFTTMVSQKPDGWLVYVSVQVSL